MSASRNKEVFRRVIEEGFNRGNFDAWNDRFPPTYIEHQYGLPPDLEGFKRAVAGLRAAIHIALTIDEVVADTEKVWARMTACGTQTGTFMGRPRPAENLRLPSWTSAGSRAAGSSSIGACPTASLCSTSLASWRRLLPLATRRTSGANFPGSRFDRRGGEQAKNRVGHRGHQF